MNFFIPKFNLTSKNCILHAKIVFYIPKLVFLLENWLLFPTIRLIFISRSLQGDDINIDGSELLYMNEHETIKIDLSMNRRGAKQATFRYEFDHDVLEVRNDLDDDVDMDEDACMALYIIGKEMVKIEIYWYIYYRSSE